MTVATSTVITATYCSTGTLAFPTTLTVPTSLDFSNIGSLTPLLTISIFAPLIQLMFQSSDVEAASSSPTTKATPTSLNTAAASRSHISAGAIAGVVVGSAVGLTLIVAVREGTVVTAIYLYLPFHLYLSTTYNNNAIQYNTIFLITACCL